jgi:hypothetical protein
MDISMCQDKTCPKRQDCRRSEASGAQPGRWQSWIIPARHGDVCPDFLPKDKQSE